MMDFKLKQPLQVMNKTAGEYETQDIVTVKFLGKKGLKALKNLQDVIFSTFQSAAGKTSKQENDNQKELNVDDMVAMLDMTSKSEYIFDSVMEKLKTFATIGESNLTESLQSEMGLDDLDELYNQVVKSFLLPKIIQRINSLSK